MILSTTDSIEGRTITNYCGLVHAEIIVGAHVFRDMMAAFRDVVGGRARSYEGEIRKAREEALHELRVQAQAQRADAVVGIAFDYEMLGRNSSMILVCINGTAVNLNAES